MMLSVFKLKAPLSILLRSALRYTHTIKRDDLHQKCYRLLGVDKTADQNTVRRAYIDLVKRIHPDSGTPEASIEHFREVDEAFKCLQEKFAKNRRGIYEDEKEQVFDINHTAPQHRQYLSFDGVGVGTPSQRNKQYQQIKAVKAQERVLDYRVEKSQANESDVMVKGTVYKKHAIKTKYGFERVVEDLIQEAMSKGDFNNLKGNGKPLAMTQTQNPYLDFTSHKLNKILLENGFIPEWISLQRDIRAAAANLKNDLRNERANFGEYPLGNEDMKKWEKVLKKYESDINRINKSIDKYNLIVPLLDNQFFRLNLEKISKEILGDANISKNLKRTSTTKPPALAECNSDCRTSPPQKDFLSLLSSLF